MPEYPISVRLSSIETALNAPSTITEIGTLLEPLGYDQAKIAEGKQLLADAKALVNRQKVEYGEQYEASEIVNDARAAATRVYTPTLTLARIALKREPAAPAALALHGARKRTLSGWLEQATTFYSNLLANPQWVAEMAKFNRDQAALEAEQSVIQTLVAANLNQEQEKGEAQAATRARDAKLDELYDWYADYRDVAVIALDGHPEWIELIRKGEVD